jgi:hypothetical protein
MFVRTRLIGLLFASAFVVASCAKQPAPVDRVQSNLVDKSIFDGEWWYSSTAIDVDYDEAYVFNTANANAPFSGSMSTDYGLDYNRGGPDVLGDPSYSFPIARIRWVIDEDYLFAYRTYELVSGGDPDGTSPDFRGEPLAVFKIEDHVDIKQDYSATTGEQNNVTEENTSDELWYQRKYMRVDWSQNLLTQFAANDVQSNELFTSFKRESVPFFIQSGTHSDMPSSYQPQFVRVSEDPNYDRKSEWPKDQASTVHYMSFVTQEVWSPADSCLYQGGGVCSNVTATMRNAFLRVPPNHEYAAQTQNNDEFDRFGLFRSHQPTYAGGGNTVDSQHQHCNVDSDCGPQGACDNAARRAAACTAAGQAATCRTEQNICVGGLTPDQGATDFLSFYASRLNFFDDALSDKTCVEDWECDGRYNACKDGDDACLAAQSSNCDPAAKRCTTPLAQRKAHPITFRLSPHFPPYLVRQAFDAVAQWNEALMRGQRAAQSRVSFDEKLCDSNGGVCPVDLNKTGRVQCQRDNPTAFCYCGSPDDSGGSCRMDYDPFESPTAASARGIPTPYDCYVDAPPDLTHPENYSDYVNGTGYAYQFKGDECLLKLQVNSCDADPSKPCEELGDIRYHFLSHLQQGGATFGGIAQPLSDPENGELVTTSATIAAESIENVGTLASQFFPVLRGDVSEDQYFTGENLRGYFAAMGKVEHPVTTVPVETTGSDIADPSRPSREDDALANGPSRAGQVKLVSAPLQPPTSPGRDRINAAFAKVQKLQGAAGRAQIYSDRKTKFKGSPLDMQLGAALAAEFPSDQNGAVTQAAAQASAANQASGQQASAPASGTAQTSALGNIDSVQQTLENERQRRLSMGTRNMDIFDDQLYNSQYWRYYANAFAKQSPAEASLRMQQAEFRGIATHEMGHVLGLRHNFAGSLDRNNYPNGYFGIATKTPLPFSTDYDQPAMGGNQDGVLSGEESQRFTADTQAARETRLSKGAGTVMTASIMDYNGDLSDFAGLGRYDRAAVMYSYFDKVEAYTTGDPTLDPNLATGATQAGSLVGLERPDLYRRDLWTYYRGGDNCQSDDDCPHHAGRESTAYQPVSQRCVGNPRLAALAGGSCGSSGNCICSNFYDDFNAYSSGDAYRSRARDATYAPVTYQYCHDNRTTDISWCTPQDAGESFVEVVEHYRRSWRERYPQVYFRNFRAAGPQKGASYDTVVNAVKIYQHMIFRMSYEGPSYSNSLLPTGFQDQYTASAGTLDWLGEIIGAPDVGAYKFDSTDNVYRQVSSDPTVPSDLGVPVGQGYYLWSEYQTGQNGYSRLERAGTFLDKMLAIQAITKRDWGLTYQIDEFFYVNFFDFFQQEVIDMFGGMIARNARQYAPRVEDLNGQTSLQYVSVIRSSDSVGVDETYPAPALDGSDTETLRDIATIEALSEFPVFYDSSFEQRLLVFKLGSGDGYTIPDKRSDGTPTCKYGDDNCPQPDYIEYQSDRLHTTYVAVVVDPQQTNKIDEQQVAYQLLRRLTDRQTRIRDLAAKTDPSSDDQDNLARWQADLQRDESFLEYLIELARQLGVSSYFF